MSAREWDLIICDEAHRMSATYFGGEVKYTRGAIRSARSSVGSAAPAVDVGDAAQRQGRGFPAFHGLLDGDRFEGRFRDGVHYADTEDMMRRLTKEELLVRRQTALPRAAARTIVKYHLSEGKPRSTPPSPNMFAPR